MNELAPGIKLVDLDATGHPHRPPLEVAERMQAGMFVMVLVTEEGRRSPQQLWFRITRVIPHSVGVSYDGELASDTHLDLDLGHKASFAAYHVLEWTTHL